MIFLDTNILIYALGGDSAKRSAAIRCFTNNPRLSVQVLNEARSIFLGKFRLAPAQVKSSMDFVISKSTVVGLELADYQLSWTLMEQNKLSHWDSLIVANALRNKGSVLYSEDMGHGQLVNDQLKIVNPFL